MTGRWHLLFLVGVLLACAGLAQTQSGHVLLSKVGLYETPAVYTELAFSEPNALPSVLKRPTASVKVSFVIHNVSNASRSYQWSIVLVHAGKDQVRASGAVQTPAQGQVEVTRSVVASCIGGKLQATARLANPAESISFWMTCPSAPTTKQAGR